MKLKITIKEVVEEERYLDENENFILSLWIDSFGKEVDSEIENYFEKIGFDYREYVNGNIATFRKETIRDATSLEFQAVLYNIHKDEICDGKSCEGCLYKHEGHLISRYIPQCLGWASLEDYIKGILKDKEVILELVE